jgi:hypothetical protein
MSRAERSTPAKPRRDAPRFEFERSWLWRGGLAIAIIAFILVLAKASTLLFGSGQKRLERHERATEQPAASQPAAVSKDAHPREAK